MFKSIAISIGKQYVFEILRAVLAEKSGSLSKNDVDNIRNILRLIISALVLSGHEGLVDEVVDEVHNSGEEFNV